MPESPVAKMLMALLKAMDNLWLVVLLACLVLLIRIIWARYRQRNPLPPIPPAPPPDRLRTWIPLIIGVVGMGAFSELMHFSFIYAVIGGIVLYWITDGIYGQVTSQRMNTVPVPPPVRNPQGKGNAPGRKGKTARGAVPAVPVNLVNQKDIALEIIDTILIAIILVFGIVRPLFMSTYFIPSGSMESTLLGPVPNENRWLLNPNAQVGGDKLIASKFVFNFRAPRRGEIIVFRPVNDAFIPSFIDEQISNNKYYMPSMPPAYIPYRKDVDGYPSLLLREWLELSPQDTIKHVNPEWDENKLLVDLPVYPADPDDFIKRVIGVAGDHIYTVAHDGVYRKDAGSTTYKRLPDAYIDRGVTEPAPDTFPTPIKDPGPPPRRMDYNDEEQWIEYFYLWLGGNGGGWHDFHDYIANIAPNVVQENGLDGKQRDVFVVPPDSLFVMGDNRGGSFDSHYWGVIPVKNARARALAIFWPPSRLRLL